MSILECPVCWASLTLEKAISSDGLISDGDWVESKDQDPNGSVRLIQLADIGDGDFKNKSERFMTPERAEALNCTYLHPGDVLIARMPDPLGRACIFPGVQQESVTVVDVCLIRSTDNSAILNKVLSYWINSPSIRNLIADNASGTTRKRITRKKLEQFELPIPPLAEQKVIADKLDTLLAQVENTKARLERIPGILKRFRQSVLAAAVSGRLTEGWKGRNGPSRVEWERQKVGKIVTNIEAGKNLKCIETPPLENEYGIIKISAVTWGVYDEEESKTLPDPSNFIESRRIQIGDFLISRANTIELLGNPVIVNKVTKNLMLSDKVLRFVMREEDKQWLSIFLRSSAGRKEIESRATGNQQSMRNIGQKALLDIDIPKPSSEEQTEIVRRVEQLFAYADAIEQQVQAALTRVSNLTQSILAKAFRGELTADWRAANPELISGENSAEALLKKIKAEREALKKQPKPKRKSLNNKIGKVQIKIAV